MAVILNKTLCSDRQLIVRAIYADDMDFIKKFHQSAGQGLDIAIKDTLDNISPDASFFKVETVEGALVGFFVKKPIDGQLVLEGFHVVKVFRTKEYLAAFWELVRQTMDNQFYTSISENNVQAAKHLLKNSFSIVGPTTYNGKNFVIFSSN